MVTDHTPCPLDPEEMEEMVEDCVEIVERDSGGSNLEPHSSSSGFASLTNAEFIPLSSVDLDQDDSKGSGSIAESCDPWSRIGELPSALGDKMRELKTEKWVWFVRCMGGTLYCRGKQCNLLTEMGVVSSTLLFNPLFSLLFNPLFSLGTKRLEHN